MKQSIYLLFITAFFLCSFTVLKQEPTIYKAESWINTTDQKEHKEEVEITIAGEKISVKVAESTMEFTVESKEESTHKIEYKTKKGGKGYKIKVLTFNNATILITGEGLSMAVNAK